MKFFGKSQFQRILFFAAVALVATCTKIAVEARQESGKQTTAQTGQDGDKKKARAVMVLCCMDDYCIEPARGYIREAYGAKRIDMGTFPGVNLELAENKDKALVGHLKREVKIAVEDHGAEIIFIGGHENCAGNRNPKEKDQEIQMGHNRRAKKVIEEMKTGAQVKMFYVEEDRKTVTEHK